MLNYMMPKNKLTIAVLFSIVLLSVGCLKEKYDFNKLAKDQWDPTFCLAIANGSVGVNDFNITDSTSYLQVMNDSLVDFVWSGNITKFYTSDFIPGFTSTPNIFTRSLTPVEQAGLASAHIGDTFSISAVQSVDVTPQRSSKIDIDSLILKTGTVSIQIQNSFSDTGKIIVTMPGVLINGKPLTRTVSIQAHETKTILVDISGLLLDLSKKGTTSNYLEADYTISFTKTSPDITGKFTFTGQVLNPQMKLLLGDVHQQNFFTSKVQTIPLSVFKYAQSIGTVTINNPIVNLYFTNSFGVPLGYSISQLKGKNALNDTFNLNVGGINPNPYLIHGAKKINNTSYDTLVLDKNNPATNPPLLSLPDFMNKLPTSCYPLFTALSNPGLPSTKNYNFFTDTSTGSIDAKIVLPLDVKLNRYAITDTIDYTFGDLQNIQSLVLRTYFNNGFPVELATKLYFVDKNYKPIYTLNALQIPLLKAAQIDANTSKVIAKTSTTADFLLDASVIPNLPQVKKVIFYGVISSPSNGAQSAKIYSNYTVDIKLGAKATLKN